MAGRINRSLEQIPLAGQWLCRHEPLNAGRNEAARIASKKSKWFKTPIPGDIHQGLIKAGLLKEPTVGLNGDDALWTRDKSWWLKREFVVTDRMLTSACELNLFLESLDANAWIFINNRFIAAHASAFYPFIRDIKQYVKKGKNTLLVRLSDGLDGVEQEQLADFQGFVPIEKTKPNRSARHRVFVRKAQYSWGWDWSPASCTTALSGRVELNAVYADYIDDVAVRNLGTPQKAALAVTVRIVRPELFCTAEGDVQITLTDPDGKRICRCARKVLLQSGHNDVAFSIALPAPSLWQPNGAGAQPLYEISADLKVGRTKDHLTRKHGVRFVELDTSDKFAFRINGRQIFCKGANFVPPDIYYARATSEMYDCLVRRAAEAHFNMLRIWGGGIYLPDAFYEACDKYGIMVWHDFMFACGSYPDYLETFCDHVKNEATYQLRRLRRHPSIVLWCGSNENVMMWKKADSRQGAAITGKILHDAVKTLSPETPYWLSSPYGRNNYRHEDAKDIGDSHVWQDLVFSKNPEQRIDKVRYDKIKAMFVSEYGYIGPCSRTTVNQYLGTSDVKHRDDPRWQSHINTIAATGFVEDGIRKHYSDPEALSLDEYLYFGGVTQGYMLAYSLETFRARSNCYGSLFWMYNDAWGEMGWSIIDYYLREKPSYWFVKRALAPVRLVLRQPAPSRLTCCLLNDSPLKKTLQYKVDWVAPDGTIKTLLRKKTVLAPFERRTTHIRLPKGQWQKGIFAAHAENMPELPPAVFYKADFRDLQRPEPQITVKVLNRKNKRWEIQLLSDHFAHAVELNLPSGAECSDNYFDLLPGVKKTVLVSGAARLNKNIIRTVL